MLATNRARGIPTTIKTKKTVLAANSGAGTPTGTPRESEIMLPRSENRGAKLQAAGNRSWHVRSAASRRRRTAPGHGTPGADASARRPLVIELAHAGLDDLPHQGLREWLFDAEPDRRLRARWIESRQLSLVLAEHRGVGREQR